MFMFSLNDSEREISQKYRNFSCNVEVAILLNLEQFKKSF